jgi:nicotinate-nucleotide pyrophosphorylase (carboxylating)
MKKNRFNEYAQSIIRAALCEDIGTGDITTLAVVEPKERIRARIAANEDLTLAGLNIAREVFKTLDASLKFRPFFSDGSTVKKGAVIARIEGSARSILGAERVALNFLQRLSGIATVTKRLVRKARGVKLLDTRKTTPCMRIFERYAVKAGGGANHRFGLFDAVLIKDNHIKIAGGVVEAIKRVREKYPRLQVAVEVKNPGELGDALKEGVQLILLDNWSPPQVKKAVKAAGKRATLEASGGITLENISRFAATGVSRISAGSITHSVRAVDICLDVEGPLAERK